MDPLDHVDAVRMLNLMIQLSSFPDSAEHRSEVLPFLLEIQSRTPEANQLYLQLRRLCRNGALHLIGATMRPSKIGRSPLAAGPSGGPTPAIPLRVAPQESWACSLATLIIIVTRMPSC